MDKNYKLRQAAKEDLEEIARYTKNEWGVKQRDKYLHALSKHFALLGDNPKLGRRRTEIKTGYYSSDYESHVVFYLICENHIEILGVLHKSMIPKRHL
ncbi:MAG: type II toxin-antitoxin system RelE/ParE family toxin [Pseudomonadales bacterium]|nr:type II toxin-antitoxin system RelE/ParE family toxin [Pseudomonadales bacterium]